MTIQQIIEDSKLSTRKIEKLSGVDHSTIARIKNGSTPRLSDVVKIANALGYELIYKKDKKK